MTTWNITLGANASTNYTNFGFDSFCKGPDGNYYGIKADGLYRLSGDTDNGAAIAASVDFGDLNLGGSSLKRCAAVYLAVNAAKKMVVGVNGYDYETRSSSSDMMEQRADIGKGIRASFLNVSVRNQLGADFDLESVEIRPTNVRRRV